MTPIRYGVLYDVMTCFWYYAAVKLSLCSKKTAFGNIYDFFVLFEIIVMVS